MRDFDPFTKTSPYILAESGNLPEVKTRQNFGSGINIKRSIIVVSHHL